MIQFFWDNILVVCFLVMFVYTVIYSMGFTFRDDTDSTTSLKRSGLSLYTDYRTGCQYVRAGLFGGLHVRVDKEGKPVCKGK